MNICVRAATKGYLIELQLIPSTQPIISIFVQTQELNSADIVNNWMIFPTLGQAD